MDLNDWHKPYTEEIMSRGWRGYSRGSWARWSRRAHRYRWNAAAPRRLDWYRLVGLGILLSSAMVMGAIIARLTTLAVGASVLFATG